MSISNLLKKIKASKDQPAEEIVSYTEDGQVEEHSVLRKYFVSILFVLVSVLSFGIGRLSQGREAGTVKVTYDPSLSGLVSSTSPETVSMDTKECAEGCQEVFASSKGKRYYYTGCSNTISEANKITFKNKEMAEAAGYTLAANCKPK